MVTDGEEAVVTDFGLSKLLGGPEGELVSSRASATLRTSAPEILLHDAKITAETDVYAFGCLILG